MAEQDWLMREAMEIAKETMTKPPGRYRAEEVLSLYLQPNFSREQIENIQGSCDLLGIDFNAFSEQHYTGRRKSFFWPEAYFFLFSNPNFKHVIKTAINSGVDRKQLADYILYVFKDHVEHRTYNDEHYIQTIEISGRISFVDYTQKIQEVKSYRKKNLPSKVVTMKQILRHSAERIQNRLKSYDLENLKFDVRYYGSLYFGDPSNNPDIDALIYFDEILSSARKHFIETTLKMEELEMSKEMEKGVVSSKASHYHAIELESLMKKLNQLEHDIKILAPVHEGNFVIDFSRAPSELFLTEGIIPESCVSNFGKAQKRTLTSIAKNPFLRASSYVHLEEIIRDRQNREKNKKI